MEKIGGICGAISWLIGIIAGVVAYSMSIEATMFLPALLIGIAVGGFIGLVLATLVCGFSLTGGAADAHGHEAAASDAAHDALGTEVLAEAEAGAITAGARGAGIEPKEAAHAHDVAQAGLEAEGKAPAADTETEARDIAEQRIEAEAAPAPAAAAASSAPDYDKDGVQEGENEGEKPATLDAPRGGSADNLKEIKGVGPKLEAMLHDMGFYHFDQIAGWSAQEVAWVDANLTGFKGRVSRDNWVEQAKVLASGEETEFSKRVDKGEVY